MPSATGMFVVGIYIIVSGIFIGRGIGSSGLAAITVVLPFTMIINSLSSIFSIGASNTIGYYLGKNNIQKATGIFRLVSYSSIFVSILFQVIGFLFLKNILNGLTSSPTLLNESRGYLFWYLVFTLPIVLQSIFNLFLKNDGKQRKAMLILITSTLITLFLEYIFIFKLHLGLESVAISLGIGQSIAVIYEVIYFLKFSTYLTFGKCKFVWRDLRKVIKIGLPTFFITVSFSLIILFTNSFLLKAYGEIGIAAFGIANYLTGLNYYVSLGVSDGISPLLSYYIGKDSLSKAKKIYNYATIMNFAIGATLTLLFVIFGKDLISLYTSSKELMNLSYIALIITSIGYTGFSINLIDTTVYQSLHKTPISYLLSFMRGIVFILIGLYTLPLIFGNIGIWYAFVFSEFISFIIMTIIFRIIKKSFTFHKIKYS
jgi:putative MATE family efflux protein